MPACGALSCERRPRQLRPCSSACGASNCPCATALKVLVWTLIQQRGPSAGVGRVRARARQLRDHAQPTARRPFHWRLPLALAVGPKFQASVDAPGCGAPRSIEILRNYPRSSSNFATRSERPRFHLHRSHRSRRASKHFRPRCRLPTRSMVERASQQPACSSQCCLNRIRGEGADSS